MTLFQRTLASSIVLFAGAIFVADAQAQTAGCGARNDTISLLTDQYGETRRAMGLDSRGIVEVFASDVTGTWSVTLTLPDGRTCLIAAGEHWTPDPGAPATGLAS